MCGRYNASMPAAGWTCAPAAFTAGPAGVGDDEGAALDAALVAIRAAGDGCGGGDGGGGGGLGDGGLGDGGLGDGGLGGAASVEGALPTPGLRAKFAARVEAAVSGAADLAPPERTALDLFLLAGRLTKAAAAALNAAEAAECATVAQPEDSGDPLRGKFTQYSPNSAAHCRDCGARLEQGCVRVGASVFSSSSRHAGFAPNYWCLECMCARPAVRRAVHIYPGEVDKVREEDGRGGVAASCVLRVFSDGITYLSTQNERLKSSFLFIPMCVFYVRLCSPL